jgi:pantoate--beta-alanine ligase
MEVLRDKASMRSWSRAQRAAGRRVGFVPTMGALHEGHLVLVREAMTRADVVVVSVYVNPSQFGPNEDLDRYPRDEAGDLAKLEALGCHAAFFPTDLYDGEGAAPTAMSSGRQLTWVEVEQLGRHLCGPSRPGFFRGIATVVSKLFHIVEPDIACFGEKDYQQLAVIRRMVRDLAMPVEVLGGPLVRDADGLALSSRNTYLSPAERARALSLHRALHRMRAVAAETDDVDVILAEGRALLDVDRLDYLEVRDGDDLRPLGRLRPSARAFVAGLVGRTRLIDNLGLAASP